MVVVFSRKVPHDDRTNRASFTASPQSRPNSRTKGFTTSLLRPLQGGLGVTSEALRAGVPIITSGILPLGMRFVAAFCSIQRGCLTEEAGKAVVQGGCRLGEVTGSYQIQKCYRLT